MVKELRKAIFAGLVVAALLAACAPAAPQTSPEQVQSTVATSVAMTVAAQNNMAISVAQTMTAQAPQPTATASVTPIALDLPTTDPAIDTATPFVVVPPSGGSSSGGAAPAPAKYACSWREVKPKTNVFHAGDNINIQWVITNTGTKTWPSFLDFNFYSGTDMSTYHGQELPALKPGDTVTISFQGVAPSKPGFYAMVFKVQGGLCFPTLNIEVGKPKDP